MHRDDLPMEQRPNRDEATAWLARPGRGHDCVKRAFDRLFRRPPGAEPEPWRCVPDPDERVLCGSCMTPNHPAAGFCEQCGKPLGFLSCMGPFERIWASAATAGIGVRQMHKLLTKYGLRKEQFK